MFCWVQNMYIKRWNSSRNGLLRNPWSVNVFSQLTMHWLCMLRLTINKIFNRLSAISFINLIASDYSTNRFSPSELCDKCCNKRLYNVHFSHVDQAITSGTTRNIYLIFLGGSLLGYVISKVWYNIVSVTLERRVCVCMHVMCLRLWALPEHCQLGQVHWYLVK